MRGQPGRVADARDETLDVLARARTELADHGTLAGLVEPGFEARRRYEDRERWTITGIEPGSEKWRERLRDAGRRGGVLRP